MQRRIATDDGRADSNVADGDLAKNVTAIWIDKDINIKQGMDEWCFLQRGYL